MASSLDSSPSDSLEEEESEEEESEEEESEEEDIANSLIGADTRINFMLWMRKIMCCSAIL